MVIDLLLSMKIRLTGSDTSFFVIDRMGSKKTNSKRISAEPLKKASKILFEAVAGGSVNR
jgi:hypothetical protein